MAFTQAQIDALKDAIGTGARSVSVDGKTVTYNSISEMLRALRLMEREVNGASSASTIRRVEFRRTGGGSP